MTAPIPTRVLREIMITLFGPIQSSNNPKAIVDTPATMFAAAPKMITSPLLKPKVPAAITAPKAKTPAKPSRNSAEASRK